MTLSSGTRLGPYEIRAAIGAGGMGEVYRAHDTQLKRDVALKVLPVALATDPDRLARFQREAELLAALNHPHIAQIHGLVEAGGTRALVMELVEGETLAARLVRGPLPLDEALPLAQQVAEALEYAHERGVIHRDLKPANIALTSDGGVKVLDFGLAKALAAEPPVGDPSESPTMTSPAMTQVGIILGTAAYMSPEQARGKAVDKRADIWAFGCVLFECLTGRRPFEGETITETLAAILKGEPDWQVIPTAIPSRIRELLRRCLQKDPRERLHDIADARIEIGTAASRSHLPEDAIPRPVWRAQTIGVGAIIVLFAAAAASFVTWQLTPVPERSAVRSMIDLPAGTQLTRASVGPTYRELALSPDGRTLVFSASSDGSPGRAKLYLRLLDSLQATPIAGTEGARTPFFSPDGQWLAFWAGGKLKKWATAGGIPAVISECPLIPLGATWGPGGTIVIGTDADGLRVVRAGEGKLSRLTTPDPSKEAAHVLPWLLPGDQALLFTVKPHQWGTHSHIEVLSLDTGQRKVLIESGADARFVPTGHIVYLSEGTLMAVPFDPGRTEIRGQAAPLVQGTMQALNEWSSLQNSGAGQFATSVTGTLVYASGSIFPDRATHLAWVDPSGRAEPVPQLDGKPIVSVRLSPDDRYLAYRTKGRADEVWVLDLTRGTSRRITREGQAMHVCWTPDGTRLTFAYSRAGVPGIFWTAADGSGPTEPERLVTGDYLLQPSDWSPDGRRLIFIEQNPRTGADVWAYDKEKREKSPLFNAEYDEEYPVISSDGRWLAYCSNETGSHQVYITPMARPVKGTPVTSDGGVAPLWAPNGRTLYYWSLDKTRVLAIDIAVEPTVNVGRARSLFEFPAEDISWVREFDMTRDGSRFLIPGRAAITPFEVTRLNLVENWFEELKAKVPTGR